RQRNAAVFKRRVPGIYPRCAAIPENVDGLTAGSRRRLARLWCHNGLLDVAQPVFAEVDLITDKERRRAERAPLDRALGVCDQFVLESTAVMISPSLAKGSNFVFE